MPFYLHVKDQPAETGTAFATREEAIDVLKSDTTRTKSVTYVCDDLERDSWCRREQDRFTTGAYLPVPWRACGDAYYLPWGTEKSSTYHHAHLSVSDPGMIAYTPSDDYGMRDRQIRLTPGRYLERFMPDYSNRHAEWIAACTVDNYTLKFAVTREEIVKLYDRGPESCMRGANHDFSSSMHPCTVYGDSDLAFAYYGELSNCSARAVCWPSRKLYGRVYGNDSVLVPLLRAAGYTPGSMHGARIHAIRDRSSYVMPYIDGISCAHLVTNRTSKLNDTATYFKLYSSNCHNTGTDCYSTGETCGLADGSSPTRECDDCGREYDPDDEGGDGYCSRCYNSSTCETCGDRIAQDDVWSTDAGNNYCESCYDDLKVICDNPECGGEWIEEDLRWNVRNARSRFSRLHDSRIVSCYCADCYLQVITVQHGDSSCVYHPAQVTDDHCPVCSTSLLPSPVTVLTAFAQRQYDCAIAEVELYVALTDAVSATELLS